MEGLTLSAGSQGNASELRNAKAAPPSARSTVPSLGDAVVPGPPSSNERASAKLTRVEAPASPFQARLNYDRDKATLFVEIVDQATGDVIQRIPAESAAERLQELTGGQGGSVFDKIA